MTHPNYAIETDARQAMLVLRLSGTWDAAVTTAFTTDLAMVVGQARRRGVQSGEMVVLVDMRRKHILPQDVVATLGEVRRMGENMRRVALMVSSTLHKFQIRRFVPVETMAFFEDEGAAREWLLEPEGQDASRLTAAGAAV